MGTRDAIGPAELESGHHRVDRFRFGTHTAELERQSQRIK
jgi:hypothetical protein